jgi:hypothetical protein
MPGSPGRGQHSEALRWPANAWQRNGYRIVPKWRLGFLGVGCLSWRPLSFFITTAMSLIGPKQTFPDCRLGSAFGGKADIRSTNHKADISQLNLL